MDEFQFDIIDEAEIVSVSRGRQSSVPQELIDGLRNLKTGKAIRIPSKQLDPKASDYRNAKAALSAQLRAAARAAGFEPAITFSPEGVPQIKRKG